MLVARIQDFVTNRTVTSLRTFVFSIGAFIVASALSALAHEDPVGDIHPVVRVENGNFAIYFTNNAVGDDNSQVGCRTVYSPTGKLLAPRHNADSSVIDSFDQSLNGLTCIVGTQTYSVPDYYREHLGKPYYFLRSDAGNERHKIPWPDGTSINDLNDIAVSEGILWLSGCPSNQQNLFLYHYTIGSLESPKEIKLGQVGMIYDFPVASNLVVVNGASYIVWCRSQEDHMELVLSKWDGVSEHAVDTVLAKKVDFNLSISIAAIGDHLCVAYHHSRDGDYPGKSVIAMIFKTID
jgi:hypothetical protein